MENKYINDIIKRASEWIDKQKARNILNEKMINNDIPSVACDICKCEYPLEMIYIAGKDDINFICRDCRFKFIDKNTGNNKIAFLTKRNTIEIVDSSYPITKHGEMVCSCQGIQKEILFEYEDGFFCEICKNKYKHKPKTFPKVKEMYPKAPENFSFITEGGFIRVTKIDDGGWLYISMRREEEMKNIKNMLESYKENNINRNGKVLKKLEEETYISILYDKIAFKLYHWNINKIIENNKQKNINKREWYIRTKKPKEKTNDIIMITVPLLQDRRKRQEVWIYKPNKNKS